MTKRLSKHLIRKLYELTYQYYKVPEFQMKCQRRARKYVEARQFFIWVAYLMDYPYTEIADALDRDHTTISHHLKGSLAAEDLMLCILHALWLEKEEAVRVD